MTTQIHFPHLGIYLDNVGKSISIFGFEIAYYGIIIGIGMLSGILMAVYEAKRTKQNAENYYDLALYAIVMAIVGARLYYVAFSWESYKNDLMGIFRLREGGLAIYGGVIAAVITAYIFARVKKLSFPQIADTAGLGLILGQIIGRWGNFFNREAFGEYTDGLFAMRLPLDAVRTSDVTKEMLEHLQSIEGVSYIQVHPTFLYESFWNLGVLILLLLYRKHKQYEGQIFLLYLLGYGVGRFWIEGLRTDQLLIPGLGLPVSQVLAAVLVIAAIGVDLLVKKRKGFFKKDTAES